MGHVKRLAEREGLKLRMKSGSGKNLSMATPVTVTEGLGLDERF